MNKIADNESSVIQMMSMGFARAAESFSRMIGKRITLTNNSVNIVKRESDYPSLSYKSGDLLVLTTQMIGELTGKSYFIVNTTDTPDIAREVYKMPREKLLPEICQAIILEIDNIISASVIGQISNTLNKEVYGDVPSLQNVNGSDMQAFIKNDFTSKKSADIIVCSTTFNIEGYSKIHPQFIWKISSRIFDLIPDKTIAL